MPVKVSLGNGLLKADTVYIRPALSNKISVASPNCLPVVIAGGVGGLARGGHLAGAYGFQGIFSVVMVLAIPQNSQRIYPILSWFLALSKPEFFMF
jgi:hypothetical protein